MILRRGVMLRCENGTVAFECHKGAERLVVPFPTD
jgi:hypothetical protein